MPEGSTRSGENRGKDADTRDTGRRGKSRRPSGEKDASARTDVDPQERKGSDPTHRAGPAAPTGRARLRTPGDPHPSPHAPRRAAPPRRAAGPRPKG